MVEKDVPEKLLTLEQSALMAAKTGGVIDFRPRIRAVCAGDIRYNHRKGFPLFPCLVRNPRGNMAIHTRDFFMAGGHPGLVVGGHDVTPSAKLRLTRNFDHQD